jgi:hypothetical protein
MHHYFRFLVCFLLIHLNANAQVGRPVAVHYLTTFERLLTSDLNGEIGGSRYIVIESISATSAQRQANDGAVLLANSIRVACGKSVHKIITPEIRSNSDYLALKAEILPSRGNDLIVFVYVRDEDGSVVFSKMYSLKGKQHERLMPALLFTSTGSIHPSLRLKSLSNQGLDTNIYTFSGSSVGFTVSGFQKVLGKEDIQFGYALETLFIVPIYETGMIQAPFILQLNTGITSQMLLKEFRIFGSQGNLSWNSALTTDLTQLNFGRYNFSSGLSLFMTKNFSLTSGLQLCNRRILPFNEEPLGISNFDRLYLGLGLGF